MNLEEKAEQWSLDNIDRIGNQMDAEDGYISGYKECLYDLKDFIKANPKITADQITEYLNSL